MTDYATRCPDCHTTFHVSDAQLDIAHGLVRCGACLQIFDATHNWVEGWGETGAEGDFAIDRDDAQPSEQPRDEPDESWAEALLREAEDDAQVSEIDDLETDAPPVLTSDAIADDEADGDSDQYDNEEYDRDDYEPDDGDQPGGAPLRALRDLQAPPPPKRRNGLWLLLSLSAAIGLGAQYVYYEFDRLVQSPYRSWFEQVCEPVRRHMPYACELPPPARPELIRARELVVRSHPSREQALQVDTVITNDAAFAQPFPALELQFSTLAGEPVARRRFQPGEYLGGDLRNAKLMPPQQPVQIALEIVDPGAEAVNYELRVLPSAGS